MPQAPKLSKRERQEVIAAMMYSSKKGVSWANCMAYALQIISPSNAGAYKLQPGHLAGDDKPVDLRDCTDLRRKLAEDNQMTPKPLTGCPKGTHEIAAYLAPGVDYHFYTKNSDTVVHYKPGTTAASLAKTFNVTPSKVKMLPQLRMAVVHGANTWTHKPGTTPVRATDTCGKTISDPDKACRGSGRMNYKVACGRYCARNPTTGPVTIRAVDRASSADAQALSAMATRLSRNLGS